MDSLDLKVEALCWLRFTKHLHVVCTEGGSWNSDVVGMNTKFSVEVEVKVSKADMARDFSAKKAKHFLYKSGGEGAAASGVPNYFYFMVPPEMEEYAVAKVEKEASKAGVVVYDPSTPGRPGDHCRVARRPTKLHDEPPVCGFREAVLKRMGSELCARYVLQKNSMRQLYEQIRGTEVAVVEAAKKLTKEDSSEEGHDPETGS